MTYVVKRDTSGGKSPGYSAATRSRWFPSGSHARLSGITLFSTTLFLRVFYYEGTVSSHVQVRWSMERLRELKSISSLAILDVPAHLLTPSTSQDNPILGYPSHPFHRCQPNHTENGIISGQTGSFWASQIPRVPRSLDHSGPGIRFKNGPSVPSLAPYSINNHVR